MINHAGRKTFFGTSSPTAEPSTAKRFKKCQLFCLHFAIPRVY
nr:MAG TPA: hypothetical protein [Caudoviricetes sp.]